MKLLIYQYRGSSPPAQSISFKSIIGSITRAAIYLNRGANITIIRTSLNGSDVSVVTNFSHGLIVIFDQSLEISRLLKSPCLPVTTASSSRKANREGLSMTESRRNEEVRLRVFRKRGDSTIVIPEQQLHLTTSRGSGLRQIKYFKLNRGRRGSVAGKAVLGGGRGRPGGWEGAGSRRSRGLFPSLSASLFVLSWPEGVQFL